MKSSNSVDYVRLNGRTVLPTEFLDGFRFASLRFVCRAETDIFLPEYSGSTFRGVFGRALHDLVCVARNTDCDKCPLVGRCAYARVFSVRGFGDAPLYKKVTDPPRPFVFSLPEESTFQAGESFDLGLTLFGRAVDEFPWLIQALVRAGSRGVGRGHGRFSVLEVRDGNDAVILYQNDCLLGAPRVKTGSELPISPLNGGAFLAFQTPVRLKVDGRFLPSVPFNALVRHLLRRIGQLGTFYCDLRLDVDFRGWIDRAGEVAVTDDHLEWQDWRRYSKIVQAKLDFGGPVGGIRYVGDLEPYAGLLALGEITHVGKGATFGLGRYRIMEEAS